MTTVLESLNASLHNIMEKDVRVYVLGEDILDPYGGAFKVTRGLSRKFPERVLTTPISEAAIVGFASGMAMRGLRPIVEIMFGDFLTLAADQLVNHAAKFHWMYNEKVRVPVVVRTPMGGRRGYGPTHSQSLEKMFLGVPGLTVIAPHALGKPGILLEKAIADEAPILFIEHKILYTCQLLQAGKGDLLDFEFQQTDTDYPATTLGIKEQSPHLTIATYGYNFELTRAAVLKLMMEFEIFAEIVLFTQLSPFELKPLLDSLKRTRKLLTVEEGTMTLGWGAEVAARVVESLNGISLRRVAAKDLPIAAVSCIEDDILPSVNDIVFAARSLVAK
jgi:pyruvate/2-oxoglutarate/acetoin dehydrogenase E1 component